MLNADRSQWTIEERLAEERAVAKREVDVYRRALEIRRSAVRLIEVIDNQADKLAEAMARPRMRPSELSLILTRGAREIAEREIPPVSLQDIADELAGDINNEPEFERGR